MRLIQVSATAPMPKMIEPAAEKFEALRRIVREGSGIDFLARCGDIMRPANFRSNKDGVAMRSWHKTGRAFDYDQESPHYIVVSDIRGSRQYFRTFIRCADQSGRLGEKRTVTDYRGGNHSGYLFDFTAAAESLGWKRVPAWVGWQRSYNRREFWHYQYDQGLTWAAAMAQVAAASAPVPPADRPPVKIPSPDLTRTFGRNDRDANTAGMVSKIQKALYDCHLLPSSEIDGIFGAMTYHAVKMFQRSAGLSADGIVGPNTLKALGIE